MNTKPISFRIAAVFLSILLGGSYLAYRTLAARGSRSSAPADLFPGPKSAPPDATLMPGSKSDAPLDPTLLYGSKSLVPSIPSQPPAQQSQPPAQQSGSKP